MEEDTISDIPTLVEDFSALYLNEKFSDIILNVDGKKLFAHKLILAARSEYFEGMFYGNLKESTETEVTLKDVPLKAFCILLKYLYTGYITFEPSKTDHLLELMDLAHQFLIPVLQSSIEEKIKTVLNLENIYSVLNAANLYNLNDLKDACHDFMDTHALKVLTNDGFRELSEESVINLLKRDSFFVPEIEIFKGVVKWCDSNDADGKHNDIVTKCVRLSWLSVAEMTLEIWPSGWVDNETLLHSIAENVRDKPRKFPCRGKLLVDENIATPQHGAKVETGQSATYLLTGNQEVSRYTCHSFADKNGITIKLTNPTIMNHIRMRLLDQDNRYYCYYIEMSVDQRQWKRIIDYSHYSCRSIQCLYFPKEVAQYVRVVGTYNSTSSTDFHLIFFEAYYKNNVPRTINRIIFPTTNVATAVNKAVVIEGKNPNSLINGSTTGYDDRNTYSTYHTIGSGAIVLQLAQPYVISSMKLLLWDKDDRFYHYYIESSLDNRKWEMVVDRRLKESRSWQNLQFKQRSMVYVRITGTHNSANDGYFHCVHFECPASDAK